MYAPSNRAVSYVKWREIRVCPRAGATDQIREPLSRLDAAGEGGGQSNEGLKDEAKASSFNSWAMKALQEARDLQEAFKEIYGKGGEGDGEQKSFVPWYCVKCLHMCFVSGRRR